MHLQKVQSGQAYEKVEKETQKWTKYNEELLRQSFNNNLLLKEYKRAEEYKWPFIEPRLKEKKEILKNVITNMKTCLESIFERLKIIPEGKIIADKEEIIKLIRKSKNVFVVHGRDNEVKLEVARFIDSLGLTSIILHEQANKGKTIIEKFEANSNVGYVIVILTPDDMGYLKGKTKEKKQRAR